MKKFVPKKILVPVDFSDFSKGALVTAADIATNLPGAEITVLHVMAEPQASVPYEVYVDWQKVKNDIKADAERMLKQMVERNGIAQRAQTRLLWGDPSSLIVKVAKEGNFDVIVMATHGRTGINRLFMGSVAESVMRHSPCPVLVLREEYDILSRNAA